MTRKGKRRSGFTLLEITMTIALMAIFTIKVSSVIDTTTETTEADIAQTTLEARARQLLRKIGFAVMGSHPDSLDPKRPTPMDQAGLKYQVNLGISDGEVVWSDPEAIALEELKRQIYWSDNPDSDEERRIVWSRVVAPYLEGEIPNGMDDNGNGLIDEKGLSFSVDGQAITMRLTLEELREGQPPLVTTVETVVACRNLVDGWSVVE
ncbi:MAG: prepilin-type N-terminal cleavage/methylation domain-containing protein [Planctomycetota bacterium]